MSVVTEYPFWFFLFCLLLGGVYSYILYYRDKKNDFSANLIYVLAALRFTAITLISFLLLSPLIKTLNKESEKPVIILARDNSESVLINKDSSYYKTKFIEDLKSFKEKLESKFEVKSYNFGEKIDESKALTFADRFTDISAMFGDIQERYSNRNVGALVLLSDGIFNKGNSPLYSGESFKFPVYTVAMGDTSLQKDILLSKVNANKIAYLGNKFPVEILVSANKLKGQRATIDITKADKSVFSKEIYITSERYSETINVQIEARETGIQHYVIKLNQFEGEINTDNNRRDIFVEVMEGKEKVLILADAPHPDITAIKQALESSFNYEVTTRFIDQFNEPLNKYNILILHQLPSLKRNIANITTQASEQGLPVLYILGSNTNFNSFNQLKQGIQVLIEKSGFTDAQPAFSNNFALFTLSEQTKKVLLDFPPLQCPFGSYKVQNSSDVLFYQRINGITTERPIILFSSDLNKKFAVISGEGIWRWRLNDYLIKNNHEAFDEIITKTIQYLSVKVNKSFFRVFVNNNNYENEPLMFSAEVYNQSYELITDPEVELTITNELQKSFPYAFTKSGSSYTLNAGVFPPGSYKYLAKTKVGEKLYQQAGEFSVSVLNLETYNTTADHNMLNNLAGKHKGSMFYPKQLDDLANTLLKRDDIKTISYAHKQFTDLINLFYILLIILGLLSTEWFLRKRAGSY